LHDKRIVVPLPIGADSILGLMAGPIGLWLLH
jgi:hypothetical protein